jgi:hypothetical protein
MCYVRNGREWAPSVHSIHNGKSVEPDAVFVE